MPLPICNLGIYMSRGETEFPEIWKALADPTRREILDLLTRDPRTTGRVVEQFAISRIAVMKHLATLRRAGLVIGRKRGRERWHYVNFMPLQQVYERWLEPRSAEWAEGLSNLKRHVQEAQTRMEPSDGLQDLPLAIDIEQQFTIQSTPHRVFDALVNEVPAWWGPPYTFKGASGLTLDPRLGGHFVEELDGGGAALLATITRILPDSLVELAGPLHMGLVHSVVTFELIDLDGSTEVRFSQKAFGLPTAEVAAELDRGWKDLIGFRLKAFIEKGERHGIE